MAGSNENPNAGEPKYERRADLLLGFIILIVIGLVVLVFFFGGRGS
jgi:hypothetical protein